MDTYSDLSGKTVVVTGSSRGLGKATALGMARSGADVVVTYRSNEDEAKAVAAEIAAIGRRAWVRSLDMGDVDDIDAFFAWVASEAGGHDVLVLNAAATAFKPLMECEPRHLERTYAISTVGFLRAVQQAVPQMEERGGGTIIAVSGADTRTYIPAHGVLAGAKAAMEAMIRYLACEIGERGVTILGVNPGTIMGDSIRLMIGDELFDNAVGTESRTHPLRTAAYPDDIAEPIVMLAGPASKWLHGSIVDADGGSIFAMCGRWVAEGTENTIRQAGLTGEGAGATVAEVR